MTYSKGPWIYDAESGEIHTKDRAGFWFSAQYPVVVATIEPIEGKNNGDLISASTELLEIVKEAIDYGLMGIELEDKAIRVVAKAEGKQ